MVKETNNLDKVEEDGERVDNNWEGAKKEVHSPYACTDLPVEVDHGMPSTYERNRCCMSVHRKPDILVLLYVICFRISIIFHIDIFMSFRNITLYKVFRRNLPPGG